MRDEQHSNQGGLVRADSRALTTRSSGLVRRGLDLLKQPAWESKQLFQDRLGHLLSLSSFGSVCRPARYGPAAEHVIEVVGIADESLRHTISAPAHFSYRDAKGMWWTTRDGHGAEQAVSFAWSPCARYVVTGSGNHERALRLFDIWTWRYVMCFGAHGDDLYNIAWSRNGRYVASASSGRDPHLKLWRCVWRKDIFAPEPVNPRQLRLFSSDEQLYGDELFDIEPSGEVISIYGYPPQGYDKEERKWRGLYGFGKLDFSANEEYLATVAMIRDSNDSNDRIVIFDISELTEQFRVELPGEAGEVTDVSWTADGRSVLSCSVSGKVYKAALMFDILFSAEVAPLPIIADLCRCHPYANVCAFSHGMGVSLPGGPISIINLADFSLIDESPGHYRIADMRWSSDGNTLYAITTDGLALTYHLPKKYSSRGPV